MRRWLPSTWIECVYTSLSASGRAAWRATAWVFRNSKDLIAFLSLAVGIAVLVYLYSLAQQGVVEDFSVPPKLTEQGYTGTVVARRLIDKFRDISRAAGGGGGGDRFSVDKSLKDSLKVLEAELPVTFVVEMMRSIFRMPHDKIGGDIIALNGTSDYAIVLRIESEFCSPETCVFKTQSGSVETGLDALSYQALERLDPYTVAVYYLRTNKVSAAESLISDFMKQESVPETDRLNVKGGILRKVGKLREAKDAYSAAIRKDPQNPSPHYNLAELLRDEGNPSQAIPEYQKAIELQNAIRRDDAQALSDFNRGLGSGYLDQAGKAQRENKASLDAQALKCFTTALAQNPNNVRAYAGWGGVLLNEGKIEEAKEKYQEALKRDPNLVQAYLDLGNCLQRTHQAAEAAAMYQRAIEVSEKNEHSDRTSEEAARTQLNELERLH
jgi:tetratricopeptide (TPR) repeat protein